MSSEPADSFGVVGKVVLDRFEVVRIVGEGGMGAVYEGKDLRLPRRVAIKFLKVQALRDVEMATKRFRLEAETLARLDHPNIVKVYDVGVFEGAPIYVMDWLDGEGLDHRLGRTGVMDWRTALGYVRPVVSALAAAHAEGIVHRDIKPANVYIRRVDDQVRLLDFGVAQVHTGGQKITRTGMLLGTPHFLSPEQWRAEELDGRSDVYAVGVMVYMMMTGVALWSTASAIEIARCVALEQPPDIATLLPTLPPHVAELVRKCLAKDRSDRQTASELASFLERCLATGDGPLLFDPNVPTFAARISAANQPTVSERPITVPDVPVATRSDARPANVAQPLSAPVATSPADPAASRAPVPSRSSAATIGIAALAFVAVGAIAVGVVGLVRNSAPSEAKAPVAVPVIAAPSEAPVASPPPAPAPLEAAAKALPPRAKRAGTAHASKAPARAPAPHDHAKPMADGVYEPFEGK